MLIISEDITPIMNRLIQAASSFRNSSVLRYNQQIYPNNGKTTKIFSERSKSVIIYTFFFKLLSLASVVESSKHGIIVADIDGISKKQTLQLKASR